MRTSVVICTLDRVESLRQVLEALRRQTHEDFEVIVVAGPSSDGTDALLAERAGEVRVARNPLRNLSVSRNLGIAAAAGEVVAFLDDDAVPEPRWLSDLVAPLAADRALAAAGGTVLDHTGTRVQWHYLVCHRTGDHDFDRTPPFDGLTGPGADPFLYVPGGNSAFRRAALERVGGFDEEIEYNFDETEVCLRLHDLGLGVAPVDGAVVHHRALPSHLRSAASTVDPFYEIKNRTYFAVAFGERGAALASATRHLGRTRAGLRDAVRLGRLDPVALPYALGRADAGFHAGLQRGLRASAVVAGGGHRCVARRFAALPPVDPASFVPYPRLAPTPRRRIAVVGEPDAATRALADAGHEVHAIVVVEPEVPYRVEERDGVWWRFVPANHRHLPGVADAGELERLAAIRAGLRAAGADEAPDVGLPPDAPAGLDDPAAFPVDWTWAVWDCLAAPDDAAFVDRVYRRLLGREPDDAGRRAMLGDVRAGRSWRDAVAGVLDGVEARGRGAHPVALPERTYEEAAAALRAAWLLDDETAFDAAAAAALGGATGSSDAPDGGWRAERVRRLAAGAVARVAGAERLPPADVRTRAQLRDALEALLGADDRGFVDGLCRLLLGRPAEAGDDAAALPRLAGGVARATIARDVAGSAEARRRGVPAAVVAELVEDSRAFRADAIRRRLARATRRLVRRS